VLRRLLIDLFTNAPEEVLFFFAGHGALAETGSYLCTTDGEGGDLGVSMDEVLQLATRSPAGSVLLVLDCCHGGSMGSPGRFAESLAASPLALLRQDLTIIAAARATEQSYGVGGHGLFTAAMVEALNGGAKDMLGAVTAPALYAYVERRFGEWEQRPVYKSHATRVGVLRRCTPVIDPAAVRRVLEFFETADHKFPLDPMYEPEDDQGRPRGEVDQTKLAVATLFRQYRDAGLLRATIPGEQLFHTAQSSHTVELTELGRGYWWLADNGKL
jgi:hypothetical protein